MLKSGEVDLSRPTWPTVGVFQLFFFHPLPPSPTWNHLAPRSRWNHNELIIHSTIIEQIKCGYCPEESLTFRSFFKISNRWICYWFECFFLNEKVISFPEFFTPLERVIIYSLRDSADWLLTINWSTFRNWNKVSFNWHPKNSNWFQNMEKNLNN